MKQIRRLLKNRHYSLELEVTRITVEDFRMEHLSNGHVEFHHDIRIWTAEGQVLDVRCSAPTKVAVTEGVPDDNDWLTPKVYKGSVDED